MKISLFAFLLLAFASSSAVAQISVQGGSGPIEINSDELFVDQEDGSAVFSGNVVAVQGSARMAAAQMVVTFSTAPRQIIQIIATGGVTFVDGSQNAEADEAMYNRSAETLILKGNVLLTEGANITSGDELLVDLKTGTRQMSGNTRTVFDAQSVEK